MERKRGILVVIIITLLNSMYADVMPFSLILSLLEVGIVLYCLIFKRLSTFFIAFLLMSGTSIENPIYAFGDRNQKFCSFIMLPGIASYHIYCILLFADLRAVKHIHKIFRKNTEITRFTKSFLLLFLLQLLSMGVTYLYNDNGVLEIDGLFNYTVRDVLFMIVTVSIVMIMNVCFIIEKDFDRKLLSFLVNFLFGVVITAGILVYNHNYYVKQMGATKQLTCTLALLITPTMVLLFWTKKRSVWYLVYGVISILIQREYTLGIAGTWWLMICVTAILFIMCSLPVKWNAKEVVKFILVIVGIMCILRFMSKEERMPNDINNYQVQYKLDAFKRIINWDSDIKKWYLGLGDSIQARLEEVINVLIEFYHKPWFFLTGKGFGGTVLKHWGASDWNGKDTYSQVQISSEVYSVLHTGIAEIFLNAGAIGLFFYIHIIIISIKKAISKERNMWCIMGVWGILFFHQVISLNITLVMLCYGLYVSNSNTYEDKCEDIFKVWI